MQTLYDTDNYSKIMNCISSLSDDIPPYQPVLCNPKYVHASFKGT